MIRRCVTSALTVASATALAAQSPAAVNPLLARHDAEGGTIAYHMRATNQTAERIQRYEADASGTVVRDSAGHRIDALVWRHLVVNDTTQQLPASGATVEQRLGFAPGFVVPPDFARADSRLTGPVLDLFTFYVDWWLAARSPTLVHAGDHLHIPGRGSNSWATGPGVVVAADAVDFDVTLVSIDSSTHRAVIDVQHLPPDSALVAIPAPWMQARFGREPNNWAEVEARNGGFVAAVGRETFDDRVVIDLTNGQIVSATMDNPIDVMERICSDRELKQCGAPNRYRIVRRIEVTTTARPTAQALAADSLFDRMIGRWVLRGAIGKQTTTHDVTFDWRLDHKYLEMDEVSRERGPDGAPAYEAVVMFGRDPQSGAYTCFLLDNTPASAFDPRGIGRPFARLTLTRR